MNNHWCLRGSLFFGMLFLQRALQFLFKQRRQSMIHQMINQSQLSILRGEAYMVNYFFHKIFRPRHFFFIIPFDLFELFKVIFVFFVSLLRTLMIWFPSSHYMPSLFAFLGFRLFQSWAKRLEIDSIFLELQNFFNVFLELH